ncbi:MAG: hypothetical protein GKR88_17810 [Flavobacteriaceae bacterium]|nr:MAG: hypothetical protein GKR88_17810 [Flavobacteriaceae bacterium]
MVQKFTKIIRCKKCVLPSTFPNISFNKDGICNHCLFEPPNHSVSKIREEMEELFKKIADLPKSEYDCIVAFSGGKDSSYTLWLLSEHYGLNCLAVTIDNGFLSEKALENCRILTDRLNVDHVFFKPAFEFMKDLYKKSLSGELHVKASIKRASSVCNSCINLINKHMIKTALQHKCHLIAGGYIGGQVPAGTAIMEIDIRNHVNMPNQYLKRLGKDAERFFSVKAAELSENQTPLYVINPLISIRYKEKEIIKKISTFGWTMPKDTGKNSSNCLLNDFGVYWHLNKHKFHPYTWDIADQVRKGLMSREEGLIKVDESPEMEQFSNIMQKLEIDKKEVSVSFD